MKYCSNCGNALADEDKFCSRCGTPAQPAVRQEPRHDDNKIRIVEDRNPLFRIECEYCQCVFEYHTCNLGYRPWYPHGFVYCPKCNKPLRHKTEYEVDPNRERK